MTWSSSRRQFYVGRRTGRAEVYVVTRSDVEPLRPGAHRSDAAFAWGPNADPRNIDLALAMLCHAGRPKPRDCARFQDEVLAALPHGGFVLDADDVALWLAAKQRGPEARQPATRAGPGRVDDLLGLLCAGIARRP